MSLTRAGENQAPLRHISLQVLRSPETGGKKLCDQQLVFCLPWISPSPEHPHLPAHTMPRLQVGKAKKSWALQSPEGIFQALPTCPPTLALCCCTQPSLPDTSLREPRGQQQLQTTISNVQAPRLTQRLRPLLRSAWTGNVLLCPAQLLASAGVVSIIVTSPGIICPFIWFL